MAVVFGIVVVVVNICVVVVVIVVIVVVADIDVAAIVFSAMQKKAISLNCEN